MTRVEMYRDQLVKALDAANKAAFDVEILLCYSPGVASGDAHSWIYTARNQLLDAKSALHAAHSQLLNSGKK